MNIDYPNPVRTLTHHENDWLPVLVWFILSHLAGYIGGYAAQLYFKSKGLTHTVPVEIVGGGTSTTRHWLAAEYQAMQVQTVVFLAAFAGFWIRDRRAKA